LVLPKMHFDFRWLPAPLEAFKAEVAVGDMAWALDIGMSVLLQ